MGVILVILFVVFILVGLFVDPSNYCPHCHQRQRLLVAQEGLSLVITLLRRDQEGEEFVAQPRARDR